MSKIEDRATELANTSPTKRAIYARAIELLERPNGWTQNAYGRTEDGTGIDLGEVSRPDVATFCMIGAVSRAAYELGGVPLHQVGISGRPDLLLPIIAGLSRLGVPAKGVGSIVFFNNTPGQRVHNVTHLLRNALEAEPA